MRHTCSIAAAASVAIALSACTTGQLNVTPPLQFTPTSAVFQMSVGTVNFAGTAVGLNVIETDRAPTGYTAIPDNTATLTGPAGFVGPAGSADFGSGTASVPIGSPNENGGGGFPLGAGSTFFAAADGFGIGPPGSSTGSVSPFPIQPQFGDVITSGAFSAQRALYGGPPAYPPPSGSTGFPEGFYLLGLSGAPPIGKYTLTVSYTQNGNPGAQAASATLTTNATLATLTTPTYASSGLGGGGGVVTVPGGVTEVLVNITDLGPGAPGVRATAVVHGAGAQPYVIPNSLGFAVGDTLRIQAFGFDYNDFEMGPPNNVLQAPTMPAQADVTVAVQGSATE